jgi:chorismate mutase
VSKPTLNLTPLDAWFPAGNSAIRLIAGPCSAESEEQVMATARAIAADGIATVYRAGVWKPRTRPNAFEGYGTPALPWLQRVKAETGLLTTIEVANAQHVEEALKHGIDILWIGARTTVNPFSVQEVADAVRGVDVPVMVKNPVAPELQLWLGALERLNQAGITKLAAIHRGFHSFAKTKYRNVPKWELAIELKTLLPELPIFCDPSHISGRTDLIPSVSQKALDLDLQGLMIETHIDPTVALSDAKQQVTPAQLTALIRALIVRSAEATPAATAHIEQLRTLIDDIDEDLVTLLGRRMGVVAQIGETKRTHGVTILQVARWEEIVQKQIASAEASGLSAGFMRGMLDLIHGEAIRIQTQVMNRPAEVVAESASA